MAKIKEIIISGLIIAHQVHVVIQVRKLLGYTQIGPRLAFLLLVKL